MDSVIKKEAIDILPVSSRRQKAHELVGEALIVDECKLGVKFKTSGYCGGDSNHGGYLEITFTDEDGCLMHAASGGISLQTRNAFIGFYGDSEIRAAINAFEFLATSLRKYIDQISRQ